MEWKYKIELEEESLARAEKKLGQAIPEDLKKLIREGNAATPAQTHFMVRADEKVFGALLSYNENDTDADTVYAALNAGIDKSLIPFGIDPFGNYLCYKADSGEIVYYDHEEDRYETVSNSLTSFMESLY